MSNVERPKHYQLNVNIEVLDIITIVTKDFKGKVAFCLGNVIKYLMRAERKNGLEDYKKAWYYLDIITFYQRGDTYTSTERCILSAVLDTFEDEKLKDILYRVFFYYFENAKDDLKEYINKKELSNE